MWNLILIFLLSILFYWYVYKKQYPDNFPPGPRSLIPFIGDVLFEIGANPLDGYHRLHKKYGHIVGFNFVGRRFVSISSLDTLQKVMAQDEFSDRPPQPGMDKIRQGLVKDNATPGIIGSNGQNWKEMRRFSLQTLRDFGFGKSSMSEIIEDEFQGLAAQVAEARGEPLETKDLFNFAILNALWRILAGERLDPSSQELKLTMDSIQTLFEEGGSSLAILAVTSTKLLWFFEACGVIHYSDCFKAMFQIIDSKVADHEATFDEGHMRDFIDCFIDKKLTRETNPDELSHARQNLRNTFVDFFLAGGETTSSSLRWAVLYMIRHPDVQRKVQKELDEVIDRNHGVGVAELRAQLPYTEAVVHEIQRLGDVGATSLFHQNKRDALVDGYIIPAGTCIVPFLSGVHKNEKDFPHPENFDAERFLDKDGHFVPHPHVVPFGVGKRRCLGEALAKAELFIFFASLLRAFEIKPEVEGSFPSTAYTCGVTRMPLPFKARFIARH